MQKISSFIVEKSKFVLTAFVLLALVSIWLMTKVTINTDMTEYLPEDSSTKIGVDIMNDQFSDSSMLNLMFKGLKDKEKTEIYDALTALSNVQSVSYEAGSEKYNKDDYTLYTVNLSLAADAPETQNLVNSLTEEYASYDLALSGDAAGNMAESVLPKLAGIAFGILMIILLVMCQSWIEPLLFLLTIAAAVLINMGSNIIFSSISDITYSIAAILQLCLSMDYSMMLMNRYRQEKQNTSDKKEAMKKALSNAFTAISSSSVTTIVGMLALVFMSFTIGKDLGFVLAKGVFLSLVCIFTVLPALILIFDKLIEKAAKKSLHFKMDKIAAFSYRLRYVIPAVFVALFVGSFFLRGSVGVTYTMADYNKINDIFTPNNPIVVLYENADEEKISELTETWSGYAFVDSVNAYSTTLGQELSSTELADEADMDETLAAQLYYYYFNENGELPETKIALGDFIQFIREDVASNEQFAPFFSEDDLARLNELGSTEQPSVSVDEFAASSGMETEAVQQIFGYYFSIYGQTEDGKIPLDELTRFLVNDVATNEQFAPYFTEDVIAGLNMMNAAGDSGIMQQELTSKEFAAYSNMDEGEAAQLYSYYAVVHGVMPEGKITLYDFVHFIKNDVLTNERFKAFFTDDAAAELETAEAEMEEGLAQLVGSQYSRLIINTSLDEESAEAFDFIAQLQQDLNDLPGGAYYIVGNTAMAYEMSGSFPNEMNLITILTAIAIFTVVAIFYRSLSIPLILVCIIQCAVFITMGLAYIQGSSIYYLPLLIVQCLLLGATVDYGILYTSYYREERVTKSKMDALAAALNHSIHTIMTSALILIVVTGVLGLLLAGSDQAISEILLTIAKGGLCAAILVIFILPGLMSALDRFVVRKKLK